ncbi:MAG: hypothetical protein LBM39_00240 [Candidatus Methanoplasma sp.]|jgi:hypothetical protein|nr:hypothetical protein [Candidatus Methanoplasma sp.]
MMDYEVSKKLTDLDVKLGFLTSLFTELRPKINRMKIKSVLFCGIVKKAIRAPCYGDG